jgi:hypothetical protein
MTVCGVVQASCSCLLDAGHDGPHVCACAGSWERVGGEFRVVAWPSIPQPGSVLYIAPKEG